MKFLEETNWERQEANWLDTRDYGDERWEVPDMDKEMSLEKWKVELEGEDIKYTQSYWLFTLKGESFSDVSYIPIMLWFKSMCDYLCVQDR